MLKPQDVDLVIAHGNCPDGFGAAYTAWTMHGNKIDYFFANYGDKDEDTPDVTNRNVLMVDFAYSDPEKMNYLNKKAKNMLLLDHHKSAKKALEGKIDCDYEFDMSRSGARMAYDFFYPEMPLLGIIQYIEDRDIWKWEFPESRSFLAALDSYPQEFDTWDWIANLAGDRLNEFFAEGRAIMRFQQKMVNHSIERAVEGCLILPNGLKQPCKIVNITSREIVSDVGGALAEGNSIGVCWNYSHNHEKTSVSLRSKGPDVSEIAKQFGGGGHKLASGFIYDGFIQNIFESWSENE